MEKKEFKVLINAPRNKVWDILWGKTSYPSWVSAFMEGSRVESERSSESDTWRKGNKVRFLGPGDEGMVSEIADNRSNEYMSIRHLGVVKKGVADYDSPQAQEWAGSCENYTLKTIDGKTELTVDMDIAPEYLDYFQQAWPQALNKVRELAEEK